MAAERSGVSGPGVRGLSSLSSGLHLLLSSLTEVGTLWTGPCAAEYRKEGRGFLHGSASTVASYLTVRTPLSASLYAADCSVGFCVLKSILRFSFRGSLPILLSEAQRGVHTSLPRATLARELVSPLLPLPQFFGAGFEIFVQGRWGL